MPPEPEYGLSFSHRRAAELGLDPTETYLALLIHLRARRVRLSLSWDEIAPEPGRYDLETVRWYLDRAEEHGCRVLLTAGLKDPGRSGYSIPVWLREGTRQAQESASPEQGRLLANLLLMLERVIAALADYDAIDAWQVENDPFLPIRQLRGGHAITPALLKREAEVVRDVDPRHRPILINHSGGSILDRRWRAALAIADIIGENLTFAPVASKRGRLRQSLSRQSTLGRLRFLALAAARQGKPLWITELEFAPREPGPTLDSALRRQDPVPSPLDTMQARIALAGRSGAARIYLQGAETWRLRLDHGDRRWWDLARETMTRPL